MIKKIFILALMVATLAACNDDKKQEKALLDDVLKYHDKVMADDGAIMTNKMQMKSLSTSLAPGVKDSSIRYIKLLEGADNVMMIWMNKFNPDFTGKSHEEIMTYLNTQKEQIANIHMQMNAAVAASNSYLEKTKTK